LLMRVNEIMAENEGSTSTRPPAGIPLGPVNPSCGRIRHARCFSRLASRSSPPCWPRGPSPRPPPDSRSRCERRASRRPDRAPALGLGARRPPGRGLRRRADGGHGGAAAIELVADGPASLSVLSETVSSRSGTSTASPPGSSPGRGRRPSPATPRGTRDALDGLVPLHEPLSRRSRTKDWRGVETTFSPPRPWTGALELAARDAPPAGSTTSPRRVATSPRYPWTACAGRAAFRYEDALDLRPRGRGTLRAGTAVREIWWPTRSSPTSRSSHRRDAKDPPRWSALRTLPTR